MTLEKPCPSSEDLNETRRTDWATQAQMDTAIGLRLQETTNVTGNSDPDIQTMTEPR